MTGSRIKRKLGWLLFPAVIGLLLLAACSPATSTSGTPGALGTTVIGTEASTEALGTGLGAGTSAASTEVSTAASTEASTSGASTEASTAAATEASTSAAASTSAGTPVAGATAGTTAQAGAALLIDNTQLIGLPVVDSSSNQAGTVADVLVTMSGTVSSVVIDVSGASASAGTPSANSTSAGVSTSSANSTSPAVSTPGANSTSSSASTSAVSTSSANTTSSGTPGATMTGQFVAVPWSQMQADPTNNRLVYQGAVSGLTNGQTFDEQAFCNGYFIPNTSGGGSGTGGAGAANFAGMWRLGGPLNMVSLQDTSGSPLGVMQSVILDINSGQALYALVNVTNQATPSAQSTSGSVAGTPSANTTSSAVSTSTNSTGTSGTCPSANTAGTGTTNASNSVVVPFTNLAVSTANQTTATPPVMVQVPMSKVQSAPTLNSVTVPMWPQMAPPGWNGPINSYWGIAGQ